MRIPEKDPDSCGQAPVLNGLESMRDSAKRSIRRMKLFATIGVLQLCSNANCFLARKNYGHINRRTNGQPKMTKVRRTELHDFLEDFDHETLSNSELRFSNTTNFDIPIHGAVRDNKDDSNHCDESVVSSGSHAFWRDHHRLFHKPSGFKDDGAKPATIPSSLGDIMDGSGLTSSLTAGASKSKPLALKYGITNPLDRMALTANGNLQRLVSSYYDAPVNVVVDYCQKRQYNDHDDEYVHVNKIVTDAKLPRNSKRVSFPSDVNGDRANSPKTWDRVVHLMVHGHIFCTATSIITVHDEYCQELVESGQVGLGQLFRYLDLLPEFYLHDAGLSSDRSDAEGGGNFWRDYTLQCEELTCRIHEEFIPGLWTLTPKES